MLNYNDHLIMKTLRLQESTQVIGNKIWGCEVQSNKKNTVFNVGVGLKALHPLFNEKQNLLWK